MKIQKFQFAKTNLIFINQQIGDRWRRGGINAKRKLKLYISILKKGKEISNIRELEKYEKPQILNKYNQYYLDGILIYSELYILKSHNNHVLYKL